VAAPRQKTISHGVAADVVLVADFALLHELHDPAESAAVLEAAPCHAVRVEALVALEGGVAETVGGLAVDEAGAECSLQAEIIGALEAVEEAMLPFLISFRLLVVAWLSSRGWLLLIRRLLLLVGSVFVDFVGIHFEELEVGFLVWSRIESMILKKRLC